MPVVDVPASIALLDACENGDIEAVKNALQNPRVNIDFMVRLDLWFLVFPRFMCEVRVFGPLF